MTINNCDSQNALQRQEIYPPQWLILCVMMHVMYNIACAAIDVTSKILTFLKTNYLKYQVMETLLNQVIREGPLSNYLLEPSPSSEYPC